MIMPEAALAQSMAIAALPTFAAQVREKSDGGDARVAFGGTSASCCCWLCLPSLGLILLRRPIGGAALPGETSSPAASTSLVAWALLWYACGLVGHGLVEIVSRAFYALHDTKTPVLVGVGAMSLNLAVQFSVHLALPAVGLDAAWRAGAG